MKNPIFSLHLVAKTLYLQYNLSMSNTSLVSTSSAPNAAKSTLARLLAAENITVSHERVETASFDLKSRQLRLPMWSGASVQLYDMLVGHEVAHALWTPVEGWRNGIDSITAATGCPRKTAQSYLNIVEDARIERLMQQKFRGLRSDFLSGYKTLNDRGFFGNVSNPNSLCFADRVNLNFKLGVYLGTAVRFTAAEAPLVARVEALTTWEEVVAVAQDMILLSQQEQEQKQEEQEQNEQPQPQDSTTDGEDGDADSDTTTTAQGETEAEGENADAEESNAGADGEDGEDGEATDEADDSSTDGEGGESGAGKGTPKSDKTPAPKPEAQMPTTNESMEKALSDMAKGDAHEIGEVVRVEVPAANSTTVDYKAIIQIMRECEMAQVMGKPVRISDYTTAAVAMANAFNRRKAADQWRRTSTAKTGSLDTLRMNQYKWNEDIFRRTTRVADGKNHGIVIMLDWSGSMSGIMQSTMGQLFILADFCRKTGVPFEVYAFTDGLFSNLKEHYSQAAQDERNAKDRDEMVAADKRTTNITRITMLNLLSSRMSGADYEAMKSCLWNWRRMGSVDHRFALNGTPTTSALIAGADLVSAFIKRTGVQIAHTIVLTDGEPTDQIRFNGSKWDRETGSSCASHNRIVVLMDPQTGASYDLNTMYKRGAQNKYGYSTQTDELHQFGSVAISPKGHTHSMIAVDMIRRRTGSKVHWIGLNDGSSRTITAERFNMTAEPKSDWKRDGFIRGAVAGWDSAVVIDASRFMRESNGEVSTTARNLMDKADEKMDKATTNRALTNAFIDSQIAQGSLRTVANIVGEYLAV